VKEEGRQKKLYVWKPGKALGTRAEEGREVMLTVVMLASVVVVRRVASKMCCTCISRTISVAEV
jgi:hypothetical protein